MKRKDTIVFIVGPTAIGKTRLSVKLARRIGSEIISCDSMQIYKGMAVLSQAPSASDRKKIRHHFAALLPVSREYSAASFKKMAAKAIDSIARRRKIPLIVGGSGLYVKALIDGLFPSPKADLRFRKKMRDFAAEYGSKILHDRLNKIDPEAAAKIHPNDTRRIIRALEIYESTGRTMTELKSRTKGIGDDYRIMIYGLARDRGALYKDIEDRVDRMFKEGVVSEVRRLRKKRLSRTARAVLGFKEICGYLDGEYDIETARSLMKKNTRNFAKRQLTWFRADKRIGWFDMDELDDDAIVRRIAREIR